MKKYLLLLVMLMMSIAMSAEEISGSCGTDVTYTFDTETGVLTIEGTGAMTNYSYVTIDDKQVTSAPWKTYYQTITSVIISEGVTTIGNSAFRGCSSLTSTNIPRSVTYIGEWAFYGCSRLASITIPEGVKSIGQAAFQYCFSLTSVTIPVGVTRMGYNAFSYCSSLTSVTILEGVTSILSSTFYNCSSLTSVTIPNSVTFIESTAFGSCSKLEYVNIKDLESWCKISGLNSITGSGLPNKTLLIDNVDVSDIIIPEGVTMIPGYCFRGFSNIKSIIVPEGVTSIGNGAFLGCSSLTSINIPKGVLSISYLTFSGCKSLTSITIPESVTSIGGSAFDGCSSLTSITIPEGVTSIGEGAFYNCSSITSINIPNSVSNIGNTAFRNCSSLTSITIPEGVLSIGNESFSGCSKLTSVTMPNSVTSIGNRAFHECTSLVSITIPEGVTSIEGYALANCSSLTSITIPSSVTSIGSYTFEGCSKLESVNIKDIAAWCKISGLISLTNYGSAKKTLLIDGEDISDLTIPSGVTMIPTSCFRSCSNIKSVEILEGVTSIEVSAFSGCSSLTSVTIPESVSSIGSSAFSGCSSLTSITLPNGVTSIANFTFSGCSSLTSVTIPESVSSIGSSAFSGCSSLTSITIPNTVTSIGSYAFSGCKSLETMVLPIVGTSKNISSASSSTLFGSIFGTSSGEGLTYISQKYSSSSSTAYYIPSSLRNVTITGGKLYYGAFYNCKDINITLGDGVEYIGDYAFYNCENSNIILGNGVTYIGDHAFDNVQNVKSLNISDKVTYIGDHAFDNMNSLETLNMAGATPSTLGATSALSKFTTIYVPSESARAEYIKDALWADHQAQIIALGTKTDYDVKVAALPDKSALHMTIGENNLINVTKLKVSGTINSYDLMLMRNKMVNLKDLDLSEATIVSNSYEYFSNNGTGYSSVNNKLTRYALQPNLFAVKLPKSLTSIESYALTELAHVGEIEIPASVLTLGSYAASNLKYLKALTFAEGSKLQTIGSSAFQSCSSLKELSIPGSVTVINNYAFDYCSSLSKIVFEDGLDDINLYTTTSNSSASCPLTDVYIGRNITPKYSASYYSLFYAKSLLKKVTIGNGVTSIPSSLFYGSACNELVASPSLKTIGTNAFYNNKTTDIYIEDVNAWSNIEGLQTLMSTTTAKNFYLNGEKIETLDLTGVETMQPYAFDNATITGLTIPANSTLETIPDYAFANSQIDKLQMPVSITKVGAYAFSNCAALSEVKLPSSIRSIGNHAFDGCNVLYDVYTYTIEPQAIDQYTFSTYQAATLHCPKVSYYTYFYDTQWSQFLKLVEFDEPYDYIFIDKDVTINDNTGTIGGEPDADINAGGGLIVEGKKDQYLNEIHIKFDGTANMGASLVGNVHAHKIYLDLMVEADKWYYFSFPFDVDLATIQKTGGYVFRYYDGQARANGNTGWKNVEAGTTHLTAGDGYIFSTNTAGLLTIVIDKGTVGDLGLTVDKLTGLNSYTATTSGETSDANKSWNFIGNPYLCYYSMNEMDYNAPVIVWNGTSYEAFRPGDDDYTFYPFQAFFVQKPENVEGVGFDNGGQTTYLQSQDESTKAASRARKARALNSNRKLINLTLTDGTTTDKTRVVFNDEQSLSYEMACDASKFETSGVAQLYSIGADGVKYSINERPIANGEVKLGYVAVKKGEVTISVARMDAHVLLKDAKTGTIFDFSDGDYTFTSEAGAFEGRFTLVLDDEATPIEKVEDESEKVQSAKIYDLNGRRIGEGQRGVNIKDGKKVINQ